MQQWRRYLRQRKLQGAKKRQSQEYSSLRMKRKVRQLISMQFICVMLCAEAVIPSVHQMFRQWQREYQTAVLKKERDSWADRYRGMIMMKKCFFLWCIYVNTKNREHKLAG